MTRPMDKLLPERVPLMAQKRCTLILFGSCAGNGDASEFKDELSAKEYTLSGMCQACQDKMFNPFGDKTNCSCNGNCDCHYYSDERPCQHGCQSQG